MLVIFGASTDIGKRLGQKMGAMKLPVRLVSRSAPGCQRADLATGDGLKAALDGAEVVISCAHARHASRLIASLPTSVRHVVLMGSAWRYSRIPNPRAEDRAVLSRKKLQESGWVATSFARCIFRNIAPRIGLSCPRVTNGLIFTQNLKHETLR